MAAKVRYIAFFSDLTDGDTDGPFTIDHSTTSDFVLAFPGGRAGITVFL